MQNIKREPVEQPRVKWSLIAVSEAARKYRNNFPLQSNQNYTVGRSRTNDIRLPTNLCSKRHCILAVADDEIIMKDESTHGTRVNRVNYHDSRCILSDGNLLGFGCSTTTRHLKDKKDKKYYVYRVSQWKPIEKDDAIEILSDDSDEEDTPETNRYSNGFCYEGNVTDDEVESDDEPDVKPDIHTLMRLTQEKLQIKEEINWNAYDYDREQNNGSEPNIVNEEPICLDSDEDEVFTNEPPRKRIRPDTPAAMHEQEDVSNHATEIEQTSHDMEVPVLPEYQVSDVVMKEKVKFVGRSRGQQLSTDMLLSQRTLMSNLNENVVVNKGGKTPRRVVDDEPSGSGAFKYKVEDDYVSIEQLTNIFITEVTRWDSQWIFDQKPNPLQYMMDVKHLDTNFSDLASFQRQMKNLLLMEVYSIIYTAYCSKSQAAFTKLESCFFEPDIMRYQYKCSVEQKECRVPAIHPGDLTIVKSSKVFFLAFVTSAKRSSDGSWCFEMEAAKIERDANNLKSNYIQVNFVTNIQTMLECFISLYELRKSSLQDVFLRPSGQYDNGCDPAEDQSGKKDWAPILEQIYEKCAMSIMGNPRILLVNGGAGCGKSTFIYELLKRFSAEKFQFANSILVCGRNNNLVDTMASRTASKISSIARFGKMSMMRTEVRKFGVERASDPRLQKVNIVFITLNNAVDLLHANREFEVCIVDDASLCSEAELLPLFRLKLTTLLLIGDEKLQTSTTQNECCRENGYSRSLFTRVIASYTQFDPQKTLYPTLLTQRRMHNEIGAWPNKYFYGNKMLLTPINRAPRSPFKAYTVMQVNTIEDIEIHFVRQLLLHCMRKMNKWCKLGIICGNPDSKQAIEELIKLNKEFFNVEVSDFDSFQGREKDVIIMIALKPLDGFQLFSTKENLLIALSRAKESLILCGNFQHVYTNIDAMTSTWNAILDDAKRRNRFFDTNGTFDAQQIQQILTK